MKNDVSLTSKSKSISSSATFIITMEQHDEIKSDYLEQKCHGVITRLKGRMLKMKNYALSAPQVANTSYTSKLIQISNNYEDLKNLRSYNVVA